MQPRKIRTILDKAARDKDFAAAIQSDLKKTLASYELTSEEFRAVKIGFNKLISKGVVIDNGSGMMR